MGFVPPRLAVPYRIRESVERPFAHGVTMREAGERLLALAPIEPDPGFSRWLQWHHTGERDAHLPLTTGDDFYTAPLYANLTPKDIDGLIDYARTNLSDAWKCIQTQDKSLASQIDEQAIRAFNASLIGFMRFIIPDVGQGIQYKGLTIEQIDMLVTVVNDHTQIINHSAEPYACYPAMPAPVTSACPSECPHETIQWYRDKFSIPPIHYVFKCRACGTKLEISMLDYQELGRFEIDKMLIETFGRLPY